MTQRVRFLLCVCAALAVAAIATVAGSSGAATSTASIAFDGKHGIGVAAANGSQQRTLKLGFAAAGALLSPDGTMVAAGFQAYGVACCVEVLPVSGSAPVVGLVKQNGDYTPLAWSPDSKYVAVAENEATPSSHQAVDVIDAATGAVTVHVTGTVQGASFEPGSSDTLVYGLEDSSGSNLYEVPADGSQPAQAVTHNNESAYPVWGSKGIAFDLITPRHHPTGAFPIYQIGLLNGSTITRVTHMHLNYLVSGLQPVAVAANGVDLAANFVGQDDQNAPPYAVDLATGKVTQLAIRSGEGKAIGISSDGTRVLVGLYFLASPHQPPEIATIPFAGGAPTVLIRDASWASWNQ